MAKRIYLAGPFFDTEQKATIKKLEDFFHLYFPDVEIFSPRWGANAREMNEMISEGKDPSKELRLKVFRDNVEEVDRAHAMVAVIDGRDSGTMFEIGYAYKANVPILSYTDREFGSNLMLAHSVVGHCKGTHALKEALTILMPVLGKVGSAEDYAKAIAQVQAMFKSDAALREGPQES